MCSVHSQDDIWNNCLLVQQEAMSISLQRDPSSTLRPDLYLGGEGTLSVLQWSSLPTKTVVCLSDLDAGGASV